jgi:hypothetical protein
MCNLGSANAVAGVRIFLMDTSTLADWSMVHIKNMFEDPSDKVSLDVLRATFARDVNATVNGTPLSRDALEVFVGALRASAADRGLRVEWKKAEGVPKEGSSQLVKRRLSVPERIEADGEGRKAR